MAKRKKQTENQKLWNKEARRINRFIRNARKRGYEFPEFKPLTRPKRVTSKSIQKLKAITPQTLYKSAQYVDVNTGEVMSGTEGRTLERSRAAKRGIDRKRWEAKNRGVYQNTQIEKPDYTRFTDVIIRDYTRQILRFPHKVAQLVLEALRNAIEKSGRDAVAQAIVSKSESLSDFLNRSAYFGDSIAAIMAYCTAMFGDLPGVDESIAQELHDLSEGEENEE